MELPIDLQIALDREFTSLSSKKLAVLVNDLSHRYRSGSSSDGKKFLKSERDIAAYAACRLPATYAAVYSALIQVKDQLQNFIPQTLLDVGAGPGTAMWATATIWPDIKSITLLEGEKGMIALGKRRPPIRL